MPLKHACLPFHHPSGKGHNCSEYNNTNASAKNIILNAKVKCPLSLAILTPAKQQLP
jgi:hypothetical protein